MHHAIHLQVKKETRDWLDLYSLNVIEAMAKRVILVAVSIWILFGDELRDAALWILTRYYEGMSFISRIWGYTSQTGSIILDIIEDLRDAAMVIAEGAQESFKSLERIASMLGLTLQELVDLLKAVADGIPGADLPGWLGGTDGGGGDGGDGGAVDQATDKAARIAALLAELHEVEKAIIDAAARFDFATVARLEKRRLEIIAELLALGVSV